MKKILSTMLALGMTLCATPVFTSCGDDDNNEPPKDTAVNKIGCSLDIDLEGDALSVFDYTATINLPNGQTETHKIINFNSAFNNYIDVSEVSFPATVTVVIDRAPKAGYAPAEGTLVSFEEDFELDVNLLNSDYDVVQSKETKYEHETKSLKIKDYLDAGHGASSQTLTLTIQKTNSGYTIK